MRVIALLFTLLLLQCKAPKQVSMQIPEFDRQGHRGCRGLMPENTIAAMLRAIDLGVTTLEMDAVITADREVILSHEPWMGWEISTSPDGRSLTAQEEKQFNIYRMDYATVRSWDVGLKPHPRFRQQARMAAYKPRLADVIDTVEAYLKKTGKAPVFYNIETKSDPAGDDLFHPRPEPFVDLLMDVINRKGIVHKVIIQSFDNRTLQVLHRKYPNLRTALLVEGFSKESMEAHLESLGYIPSIYSPEYNLVTPELVEACHRKGMKLIPWTVNDRNAIEKLKNIGVDGIITDYPNLFQP
ncbi:MAG: glycerophosphodiester phosphodiesterase [Chitinophagaceae bacterium]|jgi:glycerophosphoryl diester phosphodiesterase|nr:glycerophosphodiester phosphodiesterase [Chitinophagaceae bacterium]